MRWYLNLRTAYKLLLEFGLMTALLAAVGLVGVRGMSRMEANLGSIYQRDITGLVFAEEATLNQAFAARSVRSVFLAKDSTESKKHLEDVRRFAAAVQTNVNQAQRVLTTPEVKAELERTHELLAAWTKRNDRIVQLASEGNPREAMVVMRAANAATLELRASLKKVCTLTQLSVNKSYADSIQIFDRARWTMLAVSAVSVVSSLIFGYFMARSISVPLIKASSALRDLGRGQLGQPIAVDRSDEVGQMLEALNLAVSTVREFLKTVSASALDMGGASRELAAASRLLANGVNQYAAGQEETTVTLEQLSVTVQQNANNAGQASALARDSQKKAQTGGTVVTSTVNAMDQVKVSSQKISEIVSTVDDIAFQINLLALNAAVEAARAGELGRGFAVVAAEVRSLAQRSTQAAREIKALIQDSVRKVENASELVNRSGVTLSEILDSGNRVTQFVHEIATASKEQATGIQQAALAVADMGQVTHGNAAQTEQLSATAQRLAETAQRPGSFGTRIRDEIGLGALLSLQWKLWHVTQ